MDISRYTELTGVTVSTSEQARVLAQIDKSRRILENLLGYTLDPELVNENEFDGIEADNAFRLFAYRDHDKYFHIDPASEIHQVLLVRNGEVEETLKLGDDYALISKHGFIKYIEQKHTWWCVCKNLKKGIQIAIDANWLWGENEIPDDLMQVWADMAVYYSDEKNNIKSETLGPHRYEKFTNKPAETEAHNLAIIKKYAGGNGSAVRQLTI